MQERDSRDRSKAGLSRRTLVKGAAAGAAGAAAAAASRGTRTSAKAQEAVELRWSMWSASAEELAVWEDLANDVNIAYPNITVTLETTTFTDYWDKLTTQLSGGDEADIVAMQSPRMPGFAARNALAPLSERIANDPEVNYEDFFPSIQGGLSFRDEIYAFSYDLGPIMMFYNKDLFTAAGVPFPSATEPMAWEQFLEVCRSLTDADAGQYGYVMQPTFDSSIPWIWSGGGDYMNAEETTSTLDSPEAIAALQFVSGLFTTENVAAPITDLANTQFASEQFTSGKIGMTQNGPWDFVNLRANASFDWDIAPLPAGPGGSVTWVAGSGFGLSRNTRHPEEAWQALKVITSSASLNKTAAAGRGYPGRLSAVPSFVDRAQKPTGVDVVEQIVAEQIASARFLKTTTTWQETQVMMTRDFDPLYLGDQSVEDTIATVKRNFDELLEKHQELLGEG